MNRDVMRCAVVALLLLGLAASVAAQGTVTGSIRGTVKDPEGGVLPGVSVTALSDALVAGRLLAVTDERGVYRFPSLPSGTYTIQAELSGFKTMRQDGVRITIGASLAIDLVLQVATVAEEITVTAEAPLVSVVSNSVATSFNTEFIDAQPLPRNYYNVIAAAPGVNIDYTSSSGSAMLAYGSYSEAQNAFTLDGVNVADAGSGQHWLLPSIQWMEEIQIGGLGAAAEYGGYTGGIINGVTKSGGNSFAGSAEVYYQPEDWTGDNDPSNDADSFKFEDVALSIGGPVTRDRLWYFLSGEYWHQVTTPVGAIDTSDRKIPRILGKLTLQSGQDNRFFVMGEYDEVTNDRRGIDVYTLPEATREQNGPSLTAALNWEYLVNANNFLNLKLTGNDGEDNYRPYNGTDLPGHIDEDSGIEFVNSAKQLLNSSTIYTLDASWSLFADGLFGGDDSHSFKFGALYEKGTSDYVDRRNGGFTYYDWSGDCESYEAYLADPTCGPYYIEYGWGEYEQYTKFSGLHLYAQDSLRLGRFTVNLGFRYGSYDGGWQSGNGDSSVYDVDFIDPRVGFVWDLFGTGKMAVKAHYGRYHNKAMTYLWDREASGEGVIPDQDCYWDYDEEAYTDCDPIVTVAARMGEIDHPYVDEILFTFEQQLGQNMSIGLDLVDRKFRSFVVMTNENMDYEEYTATANPFGGGGFPIFNLLSHQDWVLTSDAGAYRDYQSAILRFDKRYANGWYLYSSLVWTDMKGNVTSDYGYANEYRDINGLYNIDGTMDMAFSDWEFKIGGALDLPLNFKISGQYSYFSGWYWTPYVRVRGLDYNAYTGRYMNLTERGSQQYPDRNLIDLRLAWSARFGGKAGLTLSVECFNCTNEGTVLNSNKRWGDYRLGNSNPWRPSSTFGDATQIEAPRQIRAGVRFDF
ncbi:MAG: carboxypeptidase regulatory-like domain-containing protein [Acidobacteriota bacterium]